jgi:hypothetical protein
MSFSLIDVDAFREIMLNDSAFMMLTESNSDSEYSDISEFF